MIRALIVDDEPLARRRVRALLAGEPDIEIAGEHGDGVSALAALERGGCDLLFLDVQMPELDGFELLARLDLSRLPEIIFVTAHDEHALRAFEVHALDYLLKPFRRDRFAEAVRRARARLGERRPTRLAVRDGACVTMVAVADVDWLEAEGNYVALHAGGAEHLLRETLAALEARLDPARFVRVHRSAIVNLERVAQLLPHGKNDAVAVLCDGTRVTVSRTYRARLQEALEP
jgi:two-component system LytT family response regulator